jgi:hypothetical protein
LVVSSFQPNENSSKLLRIAINSMIKFKPEYADIWIIDVGSPDSDFMVTPEEYPTVNFIITSYIPRSWDGFSWKRKFLNRLLFKSMPRSGSHANAWTLDFAIRSFNDIQYTPKYFMTLQMDIMVTHEKTIHNILALFNEKTAAVGVLKQKNLSKTHDILHSLGCMWNYKIYNDLSLSMETDLPDFDVGELAIIKAVNKGYHINNLKCSYSNPEIVDSFSDQYKNLPGVDRTIDKDGNVVFMHLGRGIPKSEGSYWKDGKTTVLGWEHWFNKFIE